MGVRQSVLAPCTFRKDNIANTTGCLCLDECRTGSSAGQEGATGENEDWEQSRAAVQSGRPSGKLLVGRVGQAHEDEDVSIRNDASRIHHIAPVVQFSEAQKLRVQELARERALSKIYALFDEGQITEVDLDKKVTEIIDSGITNRTSTSCSPSRCRDKRDGSPRRASPRRASVNMKEPVRYCYPGHELDAYRARTSEYVRPGFGKVQVHNNTIFHARFDLLVSHQL